MSHSPIVGHDGRAILQREIDRVQVQAPPSAYPGMTPEQIRWAMEHPEEALRLADKLDAEDSLLGFIRLMWPVLEPGRRFVEGWALDAICDHLEAITAGHIKKLIINVPPGFMKSLTTNVFWPAWEWGPKNRPFLRYVGASYSADLTERDNDRCRQLLAHESYQRLWGPQKEGCAWVANKSLSCDCGARFHIRPDKDARGLYENNHAGWKQATSVGGAGTGLRGDRWIIDDPHSVKTAESEAIRNETLRWGTEVVATRKNDQQSVFLLIMQRVHGQDLAGLYMAEELGFLHLCIPMHYEANHPHLWIGGLGRCHDEKVTRAGVDGTETATTLIPKCHQYGKGDPRTQDGELAWPERFPEGDVADTEKTMRAWGGDYAVAGQQQQRPTPRGGGLIQADAWKYMTRSEYLTRYAGKGRERRAWDPAGSTAKKSPRTATVKGELAWDGKLIITHARAGLWTPDVVERSIIELTRSDGRGTTQDFPQDPGQAGKYQIMVIAQKLMGYTIEFSPESGDKEARAYPFASQVAAGNVYLVLDDHLPKEDQWVTDYLAEMNMFPRIPRKDYMDATSRLLMGLSTGGNDTFHGGEVVDPASTAVDTLAEY